MTKQVINVGTTANDKKGDSLRAAFQKVNSNFTELYTALGLADATLNLGNFVFEENTMRLTNVNNADSTSTQIEIAQPVRIESNLTVGGDLLPNSDFGGDLGSPSRQWKSLYVSNKTIYLNNIPISLDSGNNLTIAGEPISATIEYASIPDAPKDLSDLTDNSNLLTSLTGVDSIEFWDSSVQTTAYRYAAQPTAPTMTTGALWFNTTDGRLYINYNNLWVDASPTEIDPSAIRFNEQNQIELPEGGDIVDSNGDSVLESGPSLGNWTFAGDILSNPNNSQIQLGTDANIVSYGDFIGLYSSGTGAGLELDGVNDALLVANRDVVIRANAGSPWKNWTFKSTGDLTLPGNLQSEGNINIEINLADSTKRIWSFEEDGSLALPYNNKITVGGAMDSNSINFVLPESLNPATTFEFAFDASNGFPALRFPNGSFQTTAWGGGNIRNSVPAHSYGEVGDKEGDLYFDANYIYYCKQDYVDNVTDIWVRVVWTDTSW